jgi:hypothetical protein
LARFRELADVGARDRERKRWLLFEADPRAVCEAQKTGSVTHLLPTFDSCFQNPALKAEIVPRLQLANHRDQTDGHNDEKNEEQKEERGMVE